MKKYDFGKRNFLKLIGGLGIIAGIAYVLRKLFGSEEVITEVSKQTSPVKESHTVYTDVISERTSATGVTIDGLLTKDGSVNLDPTPDSDHTANGTEVTLTAGQSLVFGNACYVKSDGKLWKADANATTTMPVVAIALGTISADAAGQFLIQGVTRDDTWTWTVGGFIYVNTTAGALTQTAPSGSGDQVQVIGVATHADRLLFDPSLTMVEIA